jgi:hypothetical protein
MFSTVQFWFCEPHVLRVRVLEEAHALPPAELAALRRRELAAAKRLDPACPGLAEASGR